MSPEKIIVLYRVRGGGLETGGLYYETMDRLRAAFPARSFDLVEDRLRQPTNRQITSADMTIAPKVPLEPIRAKHKQTEKPTELEMIEVKARQGNLF